MVKWNMELVKMKVFAVGVLQQQQEQQRQQVEKEDDNNNDNKSGKYCLVHKAILDDIQVTNCICWSNDGNTMYLADSPTKQLQLYSYRSAAGQEYPVISNKTLLHSKMIPNDNNNGSQCGVPDGSCVDADGYLWNAVWKSLFVQSYVQRIHPTTGQVVFTVYVPHGTSQVTCCCFGGRDLDILFITTAAESTDFA